MTHELHKYKFRVNKMNFSMFRAQIDSGHGGSCESYHYDANMSYLPIVIIMISLFPALLHGFAISGISDNIRRGHWTRVFSARSSRYRTWPISVPFLFIGLGLA